LRGGRLNSRPFLFAQILAGDGFVALMARSFILRLARNPEELPKFQEQLISPFVVGAGNDAEKTREERFND
jgi:hypothetical protein